MLRINDTISLPLGEIEFSAIRSQGPGGQHVNTSSTAVQLRFNIWASSLPHPVKVKLSALSDQRITAEGVVVITAQGERSQQRNREDAQERLAELVRRAAHRPKRRRPTKPTKASVKRRLDGKKRRSDIKANRRKSWD